jgi:CxxC motif-containing protein (DUF1111 family)
VSYFRETSIMRHGIRVGALGVAGGLFVMLVSSLTLTGRAARAADAGGAPQAKEANAIAQGRELFSREWTPNDRRSHGGDGLGPVYNERSCVGCHHQGPSNGGGGSAGTNIEIITPTPAGTNSNFATSPGFYYAFSFNYGPDGFEYHIGDPTRARERAPARRAAVAKANPNAANVGALVRIHPGFRDTPGVVLHRYGNDSDYRVWREWVLGQHGAIALRSSQRNPTPLFGVGLIDAIPDAAIEAGARRKHPNSPHVNGRVGRLADGRIGRFGWKAQIATLREFVLSAAAVEMGLEVPGHAQAGDPRIPPLKAPGLDLDSDECDALTAFVRSLPAPKVQQPANIRESKGLKAGKSLFKSIGCADCHVEKVGSVDGIYSDLLLHAMAPELADTPSYAAFLSGADAPPGNARPIPAEARPAGRNGVVTEEEWRTPPLWGVRDSAPYLHDGRAATLDDAIRLHGGEAAFAVRRYRQLPPRDQAELQAFLLSLAAPDDIGPK